jgi:hypothetical protein
MLDMHVGLRFYPSSKKRYHLNVFIERNLPQNAKKLFNLRHSSLRVTIKRVFVALKNRFKVLDQKLFRTYKDQVKLVLACCYAEMGSLAQTT